MNKEYYDFLYFLNGNDSVYQWVYAKEIDYSIDKRWIEYGLYR